MSLDHETWSLTSSKPNVGGFRGENKTYLSCHHPDHETWSLTSPKPNGSILYQFLQDKSVPCSIGTLFCRTCFSLRKARVIDRVLWVAPKKIALWVTGLPISGDMILLRSSLCGSCKTRGNWKLHHQKTTWQWKKNNHEWRCISY